MNIPSQTMLEATDYVGLHSGNRTDKSGLFSIYYGKLKTAPMIAACRLSMECRLLHTLDMGGADQVFLGEIAETYCDDECLTNGLPDIKKMNPMVFSMFDNRYFSIGDYLGQGWEAGRHFGPKPGQ